MSERDSDDFSFDPQESDPNELVCSLIQKRHTVGVMKAVESYYKNIDKKTLLSALIYLAKGNSYASVVPQYYPRISKKYPAQVACLKAYLLLDQCPPSSLMEKCDEALAILTEQRKANKDSGALLENIALVYAMKQDKDHAMKYIKKYMVCENKESFSKLPLLLMIRILRSNCQFSDALNLVKSSFDILGKHNRSILIEGMFTAAEEGDMDEMKVYFQKLKKLYRTDKMVLIASIKLNLMLGKLQNAIECFQSWCDVEENHQSAEFLFYAGQLYIASKEYSEGIRYLKYAIEMKPFNAEYISALSSAYNSSGNREAALDAAKSAIKTDPYCFHGYLAMSLASQDPDEASKSLAKAIELRKKSIDLTSLKISLH